MKKFLGIVIFIAVIIFAGWAYMNSGSPANPQPQPTVSPDIIPQPTPEEIVTPKPTPEEQQQKLSAKGIYIGLADSSSIEILINDKYINAKLSPSLKASFDSLNIEEDDNVTIEYTLEKGVYEVHKISKN